MFVIGDATKTTTIISNNYVVSFYTAPSFNIRSNHSDLKLLCSVNLQRGKISVQVYRK